MSASLKGAFFRAKAATVRARAGAFHRELLSNERLAPAEFAGMQNRLARDIAAFAMDSSAFYGARYRELGVRPDS